MKARTVIDQILAALQESARQEGYMRKELRDAQYRVHELETAEDGPTHFQGLTTDETVRFGGLTAAAGEPTPEFVKFEVDSDEPVYYARLSHLPEAVRGIIVSTVQYQRENADNPNKVLPSDLLVAALSSLLAGKVEQAITNLLAMLMVDGWSYAGVPGVVESFMRQVVAPATPPPPNPAQEPLYFVREYRFGNGGDIRIRMPVGDPLWDIAAGFMFMMGQVLLDGDVPNRWRDATIPKLQKQAKIHITDSLFIGAACDCLVMYALRQEHEDGPVNATDGKDGEELL